MSSTMTSDKDYGKYVLVQREGSLDEGDLGDQQQPRKRQGICCHGINQTQTELGPTFMEGTPPPVCCAREAQHGAHWVWSRTLLWAAGAAPRTFPSPHPPPPALGTDSKAGRLSTPYLHWRDLTPYWKRHCSSASYAWPGATVG